ncbi:hypothetical protein CPB97_007793 [Podila verticillata]|nr:hypothetical protein CPB97_007793 [Podila verticillata]
MSAPPSIYNILFLGETQSGKSTLIEHLKKYANPGYEVNKKNVGDGTFSLTKSVIATEVHTNSPAYFIKSPKNNERVDYGEFINEVEQEDYEDKLNNRRYLLERDNPDAPKLAFNLIDTPGLNDTSLFDEANIAIIFKALASIDSINLVAITVSNNPFTEGLMDALKAYVELLPEFNGNIVFVHTKIDYAKLHPEDDTQFADSLNEKKKILARLVGRDSVPHILIDNDIGTKQVVRDCITQNTLRNLLSMAKLNQPVPIRTMRMNKTEKMRHVDLILRDKYEASIKVRLETLGVKDGDQRDIMERINETEAEIAEKEAQLKKAQEFLRVNNNDTLELLHEDLYQQDFSILNVMESSKPMYYPGKKRAAEPGFMHHVLDHLDFRIQNVKILQEAGGKGEAFWAVKFRRKKRQNGVYHVKIYITRKKKFTAEIEKTKTQVTLLEGQLNDHRDDLKAFKETNSKQRDEMKELLNELKKDLYLLGRVMAIQLDNKVFHALVEAAVYVRDLAESAKNVEEYYFKNKEELETLEKSIHKFVVPPPVHTTDISNDSGSDIGNDNIEGNHQEFESLVKAVSNDAKDALASLESLKLQEPNVENPECALREG